MVAITGKAVSPHEVQLHMIKEAGGPWRGNPSHVALPLAESGQTPSTFDATAAPQFPSFCCLALSCSHFWNRCVSPPALPPSVWLLLFLSLQETPARTEKGAGAQKTAHQEAAKRLHALHERDARERGRRVHAEGERRHQSNPGTKGRCSDLLLFVALVYLMSWITKRSQFKVGRKAWTVNPGPIS